MLDRMTPLYVVGWYSVPTRLLSTLLVIPTILSTVLLPRLSRAFRDGHQAFASEARPALELALISSLPIAIGGALVARQGIWVLQPHAGLFVQVGTGLVTFMALALILRLLSPEEMAELRRLPEMFRRPCTPRRRPRS